MNPPTRVELLCQSAMGCGHETVAVCGMRLACCGYLLDKTKNENGGNVV